MTEKRELSKVGIRPGVAVLGLLRHLNYKPWYALAEFVDNAVQSYLDHKADLENAEGADYRLRVEVELAQADGGRLAIRDNAAGIHAKDYLRAFRPAEIPPSRKGLSEFGMGMKSAACWFASNWTVRSSALGETVERTVSFDIDQIVDDKMEELTIGSRQAKPTDHYTEIVLENLHQVPQTRTVQKLKDHLASIFRVFIRQGILVLRFDDEPLTFSDSKALEAPHYRTPSGKPTRWHKEIEFDLGRGLSVHGFAAIREKASTSGAGFALFRRNRLIEGSADEGYRPEAIFGKSNSYRYQRLFGELHLEGFEISHTKDGFRWDENEGPFLELLKDHLDSKPIPLLDQAEGFRVRPKVEDVKPAADVATANTAAVIEREVPPVLDGQLKSAPDASPAPESLPAAKPIASVREIEVELHKRRWKIVLELTTDPAIGDWLSISDRPPANSGSARQLHVRVSLVHPFMERFASTDPETIEPLLRVAAAVALAETAARESGVRQAGTIRRNLNELLKDALSKP